MKIRIELSLTRHRRNSSWTGTAAALVGIALLSRAQAQSPASFTGGTYSQSFDALPNQNSATSVNASNAPVINGTTYTLPASTNATNAWFLSGTAKGTTSPYNSGGSGTVAFGPNMTGWYAQGSKADQAGASYGDQTTGGLISFGGSNNTNRAIGLLSTSSSGSNVFGLELTNNSGGTLNNITLSYTGELFRQQTTANPLSFGYLVDNTGSVSAPTATTTVASGTTAASGLNVSFATGASANAPASGTPISTTAITLTLAIPNWTSGGDLFLTWDQGNSAGSAQGIAIDNLSFSASLTLTPANVTWAVTNGTWNTTAPNWTGGTPTANLYKDSDNATFNNTSGGTVTISTALSPGSTTVSAASGTYAFTGTGSINGNGALVKSGAGTLDMTGLSTGNGYAGGTSLTGGTLIVSNDNQLGGSASAITFAGGTLQTSTTGIASARNFTINTGGATFNTNGLNSSTSGTTTINDIFTVSGGGSLALNGAVSFGTTGGSLAIPTGSAVIFGQTSGTITMSNGGTFNGNLIVGSGGVRLNFDGANTYVGTGQLQVQSSGLLITNASSTTPGTLNVNIGLNSTNLAFTKGDVTQSTYAPGKFVTTIGGTTSGTLIVGGVISGASDLNIGNNATTGGGSGSIMLNAQNTYTGTTTINSNKASVLLGTNNALPTTTDVIFGTQTGIGPAQLDLNGYSQTISSLSSGANPAGTGNYGVTNNGTAASTLTVSGSTTPANPFSGILSDGASTSLALAKGGTNTLTLTGTNTYSGGTTVNGGTLLINGGAAGTSSGAGTGSVMVNGGTLGGSGAITGTVMVNNGGTISGGASSATAVTTLTTGALTLSSGSTFNSTIAGNSAYGVLNASGTTNLSGASFNITVPSGTTLTSGEVLTLISSNVANSFTNSVYSAGGYTFTADYTSKPGEFDVDVIASVPEPATWLGGILLVGAVGWNQRRRLGGLVSARA